MAEQHTRYGRIHSNEIEKYDLQNLTETDKKYVISLTRFILNCQKEADSLLNEVSVKDIQQLNKEKLNLFGGN